METIFEHKRVMVIAFIVLIIAIPSLAFLIKQRSSDDSSSVQNYNKVVTKESTGSAKNTSKGLTLGSLGKSNPVSSSPVPSDSSTAQISFGPTLSFKIVIQGRPTSDQSTDSLFVGIAAGSSISANPKYLLSFNVKIPASGSYSGLSIAGLDLGDQYTAYLKGPAQIASASAFTVQPSESLLNSGSSMVLISGDLNDDNVINTLDYSIARANFGKTKASPDWNGNFDFNLDGIINTYDLAIILSNINRTGAGDKYTSKIGTPSPVPTSTPVSGGPELEYKDASSSGYWMWVPRF